MNKTIEFYKGILNFLKLSPIEIFVITGYILIARLN